MIKSCFAKGNPVTKMLGHIECAFKPGKGKELGILPHHPEELIMNFSNRVSTHNVVHASPILGKGEMILAQTLFMKLHALEGIETHLVAWGKKIYEYLPEGEYEPTLHYHAVIVKRSLVTPVEFIYRSYLLGSLWNDYSNGMDPYGLSLPSGLRLMHKFREPVSTPTEKSNTDDPLNSEATAIDHPEEQILTRLVYQAGSSYLRQRGITILDAKFEAFGSMLLDDWLNGDCSRMARTSDIKGDEEPPFLDKERFRKMAISKWNGCAKEDRKPLNFSEEEAREGMVGYHEALEQITGLSLSQFRKEYFDC